MRKHPYCFQYCWKGKAWWMWCVVLFVTQTNGKKTRSLDWRTEGNNESYKWNFQIYVSHWPKNHLSDWLPQTPPLETDLGLVVCNLTITTKRKLNNTMVLSAVFEIAQDSGCIVFIVSHSWEHNWVVIQNSTNSDDNRNGGCLFICSRTTISCSQLKLYLWTKRGRLFTENAWLSDGEIKCESSLVLYCIICLRAGYNYWDQKQPQGFVILLMLD